MASITIRNLDETVKKRLRLRAAEHGKSMEDEARDILRDVLKDQSPARAKTGLDLFSEIRRIVEPLGGIELEPFPREAMPAPRGFGATKRRR